MANYTFETMTSAEAANLAAGGAAIATRFDTKLARLERIGDSWAAFDPAGVEIARAAVAELTGRLGPTDAVIEIWNGVPFLSPWWWHGPTSVWLHHVHGPMWQQSLPAPVAPLGNLLEERLAPPFYRRVPMVTLSPSSKQELVHELGFDDGHVTVVPPGINSFFSPSDPTEPTSGRSPTPLAVAVGRLTPVKDFSRLVRVMAAARSTVSDLELVIVGDVVGSPNFVRSEYSVGRAQFGDAQRFMAFLVDLNNSRIVAIRDGDIAKHLHGIGEFQLRCAVRAIGPPLVPLYGGARLGQNAELLRG